MTSGAQQGWYQQPDGSQRYWDGEVWTDHFAPAPVAPPAPPHGQGVQPFAHGAVATPVVAPKSPGLALLGSFFIPGLGQLINGNGGMAAIFFVVWLVSWLLVFVLIGIPMVFGVWIWSMVDAYTGAQKWNARHGIIS